MNLFIKQFYLYLPLSTLLNSLLETEKHTKGRKAWDKVEETDVESDNILLDKDSWKLLS